MKVLKNLLVCVTSLCMVMIFSGFTIEEIPEGEIAYSPNGLAEHPHKATRISATLSRNSNGKTFDADWYNTESIPRIVSGTVSNVGECTYGYHKKYDTDYCFVSSGLHGHYAGVINDNGTYWSDLAHKDARASVEVRHKGDYVQYLADIDLTK